VRNVVVEQDMWHVGGDVSIRFEWVSWGAASAPPQGKGCVMKVADPNARLGQLNLGLELLGMFIFARSRTVSV